MFSTAETFQVSFVDEDGLKHTLHGIRKVEMSELPLMIDAPMPSSLPLADSTDGGGKPYQNGKIYTWSDGTKAQFRNKEWIAVKEPNRLCKTP